ncbi:HxlR family transcriptional regulator [Natrialba hulunbeirensis JCM 10989]|uniref:HxlR family transcriptional regulator n=1 Tax=Natrialba hulunbeirensis JCM 10989 TaxID=1227493 RepID=L9ZUJ3_9EURY|nr:winged helix-turn-helix transcriptional regulator [Natrialba hulunbeirensis]ELY90145.1 HxlR family transcriptional regulator [Natrialba hulunbeirensis JCM 10989]
MSTPPTPAESTALAILGTKWKPRLIVALATNGRLGFGDLKRELPNISGKVLSENLEELRDHGVVSRDVLQEQPRRVEYELTGAGRELYGLLESLADWDATYATERGVPTVLLAEDDPRLRELYALWLQTDYDVATAADGKEALRLLDESIDVAVLARGLPTLDGTAIAAALETAGQRTPVAIVTSGDVSPDDVSIPADVLVRDPLSKTTLRDAVRRLTRLRAESAIGRDIRARRHRLAFVERHLGPTAPTAESYQQVADELATLEQDRAAAAETREPWRRLRSTADPESAGVSYAQRHGQDHDYDHDHDHNQNRTHAVDDSTDDTSTHDGRDGDENE